MALALGGCSSSDAPASAPPSAISMMPTANDFVSSVIRSRDLGTADVRVEASRTVDGVTRAVSGVGSVSLPEGVGDITWTDADGTTRERGNTVALFVQTDPPDGSWTRLADGETTPLSGFADPLGALGSVEVFAVAPAEDEGTEGQTVYSGLLPSDPDRLANLGFTDEDMAGIGDAWQGASIDVDVWVDRLGRVVRVDRSFDVAGSDGVEYAAAASTQLSDFSGVLDLTSPPSESVVNAPDSQ